ncbi:hypothetical protein MUCCIDRAFT_115980 [Mucor lusitanicus CBS 277.49]|uniref:Secreted protein n=1 Tax=Mucor lusitanicus CBS 277.49 TaxID=747725 RepID=A0A168GPJ2_MUCCL|nr:hypothetical protein MUCCIDRAFT_115980 [Mucor lusitanicus CBS 277.49]
MSVCTWLYRRRFQWLPHLFVCLVRLHHRLTAGSQAGIEEGRNNPISIDYDTTNVAIENLFHANFEEFRQYRCYQLE